VSGDANAVAGSNDVDDVADVRRDAANVAGEDEPKEVQVRVFVTRPSRRCPILLTLFFC
jgi:hypothetical protein